MTMKRLKRLLFRMRGPLLPLAERHAALRLTRCPACGADLVNPMDWHEHDEVHLWMLLRCGECLHAREVVITDEQARQFDRDLTPGLKMIERTIEDLDRQRMRWELELLVAALAQDLVSASDFAPHRPR